MLSVPILVPNTGVFKTGTKETLFLYNTLNSVKVSFVKVSLSIFLTLSKKERGDAIEAARHGHNSLIKLGWKLPTGDG